MISTVSS